MNETSPVFQPKLLNENASITGQVVRMHSDMYPQKTYIQIYVFPGAFLDPPGGPKCGPETWRDRSPAGGAYHGRFPESIFDPLGARAHLRGGNPSLSQVSLSKKKTKTQKTARGTGFRPDFGAHLSHFALMQC